MFPFARDETRNRTVQNTTDRATSLRQLDHWDETNTLGILTQLHGSVWPKVWIFGVVNVLLTYLVYILRKYVDLDLTSRAVLGHRYMSLVMSFLVVTRVKVTYDRFMVDSTALQDCFRCTRELVNFCCHLTNDKNHDPSLGPSFRHTVSLAMLKLLAVSMQVLDFRTSVYAGKVTTLPSSLLVFNDDDAEDLRPLSNRSHQASPSREKRHANRRRRSTVDFKMEAPMLSTIPSVRPIELLSEACRAPIHCSFDVAAAIMVNQRYNDTNWRHPCNEEMRLVALVDEFREAFHVLERNMTTPVPFPLVQMTKTFLFVWIFSLPFAMPVVRKDLLMSLVLVFLITYGFIGLEFVAMELTDCFGDDPCDLDKFGGAEQCFEDCYLAIYKCDGREWALRLKEGIEDYVEYTLFADANNNPILNCQTWP